jgi:LCP family protein required for cell wall assembly
MSPVASPGSPSAADSASRDAELARIRFRRAVTLLAMTLVLPGSAQLVAGRREVGRIAIRVWLGTLAAAAILAVAGMLWHGFVFWLVSNTLVLGVLRLALCALAVGWAALFVDAWRLGRPLELQQRQRLAVVGLNGVLCLGVAGALLFTSHLVAVQRDFIIAMFGDGTASGAHDGRYNVLLLGGDSGAGRWGMRPDSLTLASIDAETGRTVLFGLPRNLTGFDFPEGSVMAEQFPDGYDCDTCTLNSLVTFATDNRSLFEGVPHPGVEATVQGVEGLTGLSVNYYAMVNLQGFRSLVAAMGGLTLNVRDRLPLDHPATRWLEPGVQKLDGYETLWFARGRDTSDDYSRMARQKCVMNAMLAQLSPTTVITRFESLAKAGENLIETDLPASELDRFIDLALKARRQPMSTVSFVPPAIDTSDPDLSVIHAMVEKAISRAEGESADQADKENEAGRGSKAGFSRRSGQGSTGGSLGNLSGGYAANEASDLTRAC